jgi:hypothetical protein
MPIARPAANAAVKRWHYSHKIVPNSQLHLGVFLAGQLEGVMQFGPSMDKRKVQSIVRDTPWNGFLELNRLAFSDRLPRNSESRALAVAFRLIRKNYPHVQWIISYADGTQSGDGTIYRAAGFTLTGIRKNQTIWGRGELRITNISVHIAPRKKELLNRVTAPDTRRPCHQEALELVEAKDTGAASMRLFREAGFAPLPGFQLRYIYFLDPTARARLVPPALPFSHIDEMEAGMYLGKPMRAKQAMAGHPPDQRRGSTDPHAPTKKRRAFRRGAGVSKLA